MELCSGIFRQATSQLLFIASVFPEIRRWLLTFARATAKLRRIPWPYLKQRVKKIVEEKRKTKNAGEHTAKSVDFIQLLIDAEADDTETDLDMKNVSSEEVKSLTVKKRLTSGEIASQSFLFLLAGFETTSTALSFTTYLLAKHQHIQDILLSEIDEHFSENQEITYESVQKLPYLECVIQEALRMYPLASPAVTRRCMEPCMIKGIYIPEGLNIAADVWSLHYNEDLWGTDVNEFQPARFLPDATPKAPPHPCAYMPFGTGPRYCIGMRFALFEMKVALCSILKKYRVLTCSKSEDPLQLRFTQITLGPKNGVHVKLQQRN